MFFEWTLAVPQGLGSRIYYFPKLFTLLSRTLTLSSEVFLLFKETALVYNQVYFLACFLTIRSWGLRGLLAGGPLFIQLP